MSAAENHLAALRNKHSDLDDQITRLSALPSSDDIEVTRLKKQKLALKEEIEHLETRH